MAAVATMRSPMRALFKLLLTLTLVLGAVTFALGAVFLQKEPAIAGMTPDRKSVV